MTAQTHTRPLPMLAGLERDPRIAGTRPSVRRVSFVIPVRNDAAGVARCLASIRTACQGIGPAEVIVVDNGSSDGSAQVARRAGCSVLVLPRARVAALRNAGAAHASGDILVFVDADHEIAPGWIRAALEVFEDLRVSAAGAPYSSPAQPTWVQRAYDALRDHAPGRRPVPWLASGNLAIRRTLFVQLGGFDPSLEACEDVDLCRRLRGTGGLLVSDARLHSVHHGDPGTLRELFTGELWRGRNNLQVSLREELSIGSAISLAIPLYQLVTVAAGAIAVSMGAPALAAAALPAFAVPSAARTLLMRRRKAVPLAEGLAFALVFDTARALALLMRKKHRRVRPEDDPGHS